MAGKLEQMIDGGIPILGIASKSKLGKEIKILRRANIYLATALRIFKIPFWPPYFYEQKKNVFSNK